MYIYIYKASSRSIHYQPALGLEKMLGDSEGG